MAGTFMIGLSLALVINGIRTFCPFDISRILPWLVVLISIAGSLGALSYFVERQNHAVENYAELLGYPTGKEKHSDNAPSSPKL
jgi:hypothetical protein